MTNNLRDRLAVELDQAVARTEDLAADALVRGRARLRVRRAVVGLAAAAVVTTAGWTGASLMNPGPDRTLVADAPASSPGAVGQTASVRAEWDALVLSYFESALPSGFAPLAQSGGGESGQYLEFLTNDGRGDVQLAATVYIGGAVSKPSCATTIAQECREIVTPSGATAVILRNVYTDQPNMPQASRVDVSKGNTQTIINVVETSVGQSQFSLDDLVGLATSSAFDDMLTFATRNAEALRDYGTNFARPPMST